MKFIMSLLLSLAFCTFVYSQNISIEASKLKDAVDPHKLGRHSTVEVTSSDSFEMLKEYVSLQYEDLANEFTFKLNQTEMTADEKIAGTMQKSKVFSAVDKYLISWYSEDQEVNLPQMVTKVNSSLRNLVKLGADFGFDGFWQNGCAAPTYFLMVLDKKRAIIEGIDLNPCEE